MKRFESYLGISLALLIFVLVKLSPWNVHLTEVKMYCLAFFICLDYLIHSLVSKGLEQDNFIVFFMASLVSKLVFILVFTGFMLHYFQKNSKEIVLSTLGLYLFFSFFDILVFLRKLRRF